MKRLAFSILVAVMLSFSCGDDSCNNDCYECEYDTDCCSGWCAPLVDAITGTMSMGNRCISDPKQICLNPEYWPPEYIEALKP